MDLRVPEGALQIGYRFEKTGMRRQGEPCATGEVARNLLGLDRHAVHAAGREDGSG